MPPTPEFADFEAPPEPAPLSEVARLTGVFFSPGKTFQDIAKRPHWFVPVLLGMIVTTTFLYLFSQRVGWELFFRQQNAQNVQVQNLTEEQRVQAERIQQAIAKYLTWGSGLIAPLFVAVVISGVLKFLADTVMGAGIGFKKTLAVVTYGTLPNLIKSGLAILVMYLKPPDEFDLQNPLMVNAAAFLPADASAWMKALGSSLDLFTFWCMILIAIGLAAAAKRLTAGKAFGMILFPWALIVIISVGFSAAFRR
jgi:hypothetical protein